MWVEPVQLQWELEQNFAYHLNTWTFFLFCFSSCGKTPHVKDVIQAAPLQCRQMGNFLCTVGDACCKDNVFLNLKKPNKSC